MKKTISSHSNIAGATFIAAILLAVIPFRSMAQWTTEGRGIYYNKGKVSIGTSNFYDEYNLYVEGNTRITGSLFVNNFRFKTEEFTLKQKDAAKSLIRGLYKGSHNTLVINSDASAKALSDINAALIVNGTTLFATDANSFDHIPTAGRSLYNVFVQGGLLTPEVGIATPASWPDYVFGEDYQLSSLDTVERYISDHGHLPGVPSAQEVEDKGFYSGNELAIKLLEKVEELTLYTIQQDKEIDRLRAEIDKLKKENNQGVNNR